MITLDQIKITRRDQQVLKLLVLGCSNKDIAAELHISPRTVKQHLRTLFLRAGIQQGRKRVILATAIFEKEQMNYVATRTVDLPGNRSNHVGMAGGLIPKSLSTLALPNKSSSTSCAVYLTNSGSGAGSSWTFTWLLMAAPAGQMISKPVPILP